MIPLKSDSEIQIMRQAGKILAEIMARVNSSLKAGMTTMEIDMLAENLINKAGVRSAFKGYKGYPANVCTSVNQEVVHGIPGDKCLKDGDIVGLDMGIEYQGFFSDIAVTVGIGEVSPRLKKLIEVTRKSLFLGIKQAKPENRLGDISYAVQDHVEKHGFSVVRQFVGHGIGKSLHEDPEIANFGRPHQGQVLKNGMVFAIEPMVNLGGWECEILSDGWTAVTKDGLASAHFEHTVAITDNGPEILTQL